MSKGVNSFVELVSKYEITMLALNGNKEASVEVDLSDLSLDEFKLLFPKEYEKIIEIVKKRGGLSV